MKNLIVGLASLGLVLVGLGLVTFGDCTESITIASWNILNLGSETDVTERAEIVARYDIVALQEVEVQQGAQNLLLALSRRPGEEWAIVLSPKVGEGNAAEYYAFVYRSDILTHLPGPEGVYPEMTPEDFSRPPFFATFRAGAFDFTLITAHITWGESASLRTAECHRLAFVWDYVQDLDPTENDLILLGDFNRDKPTHGAFAPLRNMGLVATLTNPAGYTTYSTLPERVQGSWYDHLWIDPTYTGLEFTGTSEVYYPHLDYLATADHPHLAVRTEISDHCPIWASFCTDQDDDIGSAAPSAHTVIIDGVDPQGECIRLRNTGCDTVDLAGWRLTDGEGDYTFPQGWELAAGEPLDVCIDQYNPEGNTRRLYLGNTRDEVTLYAPDQIDPVDTCLWGPGITADCLCGSS